jgi:hypothetical protein
MMKCTYQKCNHEVTKTRRTHTKKNALGLITPTKGVFFVVSCFRGEKCRNHEGR